MELPTSAPKPAPPMSAMKRHPIAALVRAMRPWQWSKNVLVFVAPGAAGALVHSHTALQALGAFGVFCAAASATYLVNDSIDAELDRSHPTKRHRPIASGDLRLVVALISAAILFTGALVGAGFISGYQFVAVVASYCAITVSYSLWLKNQPVIEMTAVAAGFVLRAVGGGIATHVALSNWFLVVTSFGALFLVIGKRTGEHETLGEQRGSHRSTLDLYSPQFLRSALTLSAAGAVTTYCLWAFDKSGLSHHTHHLVLIEISVAPVITAVLYVLRILDAGGGGSPTRLVVEERTLAVLVVLWASLVSLGVYA